ncbi:MAG: hypothetical protein JSV91_05730 [Phycisphaerales bacterium]|nr:MAG: hypothetical protein JSV91_05730 [Phycisphaerales bacterium]
MPPRPLYYTFGNHKHWVDMQWLWGYDVLPGSVADMLKLVVDARVRGNVNFDGIGYEKMAAECPDALADLRRAVDQGKIEPVGCSYGQPYGLFHGGESNIRQFTFGVRTVLRHLDVRPRTFWEEEFYFFPQLPQLLRGCGFTGACLFFQWTWHTPEIPRERDSLILWEGTDGSRISALPRNELNVHQWPEDFDGLLQGGLIDELDHSAIVQWLELMPGRDWMCRSELILPRLKELMADERFEIRPGTCSEVINSLRKSSQPPVRRYTMDDVWHGMTLGKNGDAHPRRSRSREEQLVAAEAASALAGLFGRPYAQWDLYPTWELDEAWRELLAAQHHDNHECEGLCGYIGHASYDRSGLIGDRILTRTARHLVERASGPSGRILIFNRCGFARNIDFYEPRTACHLVAPDVPPFGYVAVDPHDANLVEIEPTHVEEEGDLLRLIRGNMRVEMDSLRGVVTQIITKDFPNGLLPPGRPLGLLSVTRNGEQERFESCRFDIFEEEESHGEKFVEFTRTSAAGDEIRFCVSIDGVTETVALTFEAEDFLRPDAGLDAGLRTQISPAFDALSIRVDTPYGIESVQAAGEGKRKYPTGDWMTSPQWFETVENPFTGLTFVDLIDAQSSDGRGILCVHTGGQQFFRTRHGISALLTTYDPWDERYFRDTFFATFRLFSHGRLTDAERARLALLDAVGSPPVSSVEPGGDLPPVFGSLEVCGAPNVLATAFYRESMKSGENLPDWAGHRMRDASNGQCTHPFVVRLVEFDNQPADVVLKFPGEMPLAVKTNLMGEVGQGVGGGDDTAWLETEPAEPPDWARNAIFTGAAINWSQVAFKMRPREIATVMVDLVMGRKEWRDLDAKREVWARVHKEQQS